MVIKRFFSKVADLQPDTFLLKRHSAMCEIFQYSLFVENFGVAIFFVFCVKSV